MINSSKNYILSKFLISAYADFGIRDAFVSPGSRNTPLILALSDQKKINIHNIIDERISGYIGLGLAKVKKNPVLIITTSGTAVSNLFPSIVEAYMSCTPMIVLTADRPKNLLNTGANQTINQHSIFGHYSRFFVLPNTKDMNENKISAIVLDSYKNAMGFSLKNKGPVHINIPFDLPLHISKRHQITYKKHRFLIKDLKDSTIQKKVIFPNLNNFSKLLIIATDIKDKNIISLAEKYNIPIFMECRGLRFNKKSKNIISGYDFILKNRVLNPDLILRFGNKPISNLMNEFIDKNKKIVYLIKENKIFNDDSKHIISCSINMLRREFEKKKPRFDVTWLESFIKDGMKIRTYFNSFFKSPKHHEGYIIHQIILHLPQKSNLMIGNSSAIRNLDRFTFNDSLNIQVFSNRGVSGIDGLISTSIGMSMDKRSNNFLILGDISFFYDISSLINQSNISFNLTIFILNNHGGHIFDHLEGLKNEKKYKNHWLTPIDLNVKDLAKAFKCKYLKIDSNSYKDIRNTIISSKTVKGITLVEIDINSDKTSKINQKIEQETAQILRV